MDQRQAVEFAVREAWTDATRFQPLTPEDRELYLRPGLVVLDPPLTHCARADEKRQNWLNWRAASYPANRHAEYLFRRSDIGTDHPRILLSAVLDISAGLDCYLAQFNKKQRYGVTGKKAVNAGYTTRDIYPPEHAADIWDIIHSSDQRQGRQIATTFHSRAKDYAFAEYQPFTDPNYKDICVGGFSPEGKMVAFILGKRVGDHVQYDEIMGHNDHLKLNVMFLTHYFFLQRVLEQEVVPRCLNYGPWYSGANAYSPEGGLNFWKRKTRFHPAYLISASS